MNNVTVMYVFIEQFAIFIYKHRWFSHTTETGTLLPQMQITGVGQGCGSYKFPTTTALFLLF